MPRTSGDPPGGGKERDWGEVSPYDWIATGHDFTECDVIRWIEVVWERKGPKRQTRSIKIAEREVIAEVLEEDEEEGWVYLKCLKSETTWVRCGFWKKRIRTLPRGQEFKRKRHNIVRKSETVYRLRWSDESARDAVIRDRAARTSEELDFDQET